MLIRGKEMTINLQNAQTKILSIALFVVMVCTIAVLGTNHVHAVTCNGTDLPTQITCPAVSDPCAGATAGNASAAGCTINQTAINTGDKAAKYVCGKGEGNEVKVAFDFGCIGSFPDKYNGATLNPIIDIMFAIFRFLSAGVGLVVIGSIIVAGIQYSASRGDPQAIQTSIHRISNSLIGLLIYIFMFAIANYLVPGGMFIS